MTMRAKSLANVFAKDRAIGVQRIQRRSFVRAHEARIAGHAGTQDRRKFSLGLGNAFRLPSPAEGYAAPV